MRENTNYESASLIADALGNLPFSLTEALFTSGADKPGAIGQLHHTALQIFCVLLRVGDEGNMGHYMPEKTVTRLADLAWHYATLFRDASPNKGL